VLALGTTSCGLFTPFEAAQPTDDTYAVCYSTLGATAQEVEQLAANECPAGAKPHLVRQGANLVVCPLLTPIRAVFTCAKP
jgi:hypothetical protein